MECRSLLQTETGGWGVKMIPPGVFNACYEGNRHRVIFLPRTSNHAGIRHELSMEKKE